MYFLAADMIVSLGVLWMMQQNQEQQGILVINIIAVISCIQLNRSENFVTNKKYETIYDSEKVKLLSSYPVSYTHLDVYKRQVVHNIFQNMKNR